MCDNRQLTSGKLSLSDLGGTTKTPRGVFDVLLFKLELLTDLLTNRLDDCQIAAHDKALIRKKMGGFKEFEKARAEAWTALLAPSGRQFAEAIEAGVHGQTK